MRLANFGLMPREARENLGQKKTIKKKKEKLYMEHTLLFSYLLTL